MTVIYLIAIIFGISFQNIVKKPYTQKASGKGAYIFSLMTSLSALLFFLLTSKSFAWDNGLIVYAIMFGVVFATTQVTATLSVACGSLSLTTLLISYSLMIPTVYGLIFLNEEISAGLIPGIVLLCISLYLTNKKTDDTKITLKWLIYVSLSTVCNGLCVVVQKMQQVKFDGLYKNEFMIVSLAIVVLILAFFVLFKERKEIGTYFRLGWKEAIMGGLTNGMVNLFTMILTGLMAASLMFPLISVGGIIVTYLVSKFYYHEELTKMQTIGLFVGMASVVLLNI